MANSIFVDGGATPSEIGLPDPPTTITESADCALRGYGSGCGVRVDRDSLNQQIWALAWVAYRAGMTPACGTTEADVSWLANAIEALICQNAVATEATDPTATGATVTTTTVTNPDGSVTVCETTDTGDVCPRFHFNTATGAMFVWNDDAGAWVEFNPKPTVTDTGTGFTFDDGWGNTTTIVDDVVTGLTFNAGTGVLTLSTRSGTNYTATITSTDDVINGLTFNAVSNVLTATTVGGASYPVDLSDLQDAGGGGGGNFVLAEADRSTDGSIVGASFTAAGPTHQDTVSSATLTLTGGFTVGTTYTVAGIVEIETYDPMTIPSGKWAVLLTY